MVVAGDSANLCFRPPLTNAMSSSGENPITFLIVSASYQCVQWVARCIESVRGQTYPHFRHVLVDDCSTDGTAERARQLTAGDARFQVIANTERRFPLANIVRASAEIGGGPNDVLVVLDGDDWFAHANVLDDLAGLYGDRAVWLSYGSHTLTYPPRRIDRWLRRAVRGKVYAYPEVVAEFASYRYYDFIAHHLRSYRRFLWEAIRDDDLRDADGGYYRAAADLATMIPMLEMATPAHWRFVPREHYVYNNKHGYSENRPGSRREQLRVAMEVRSKPRYQPLSRQGLQ